VRVGLDARNLRAGAARGVARYTHLLLSELARANPEDEWIALAPGGPSERVPGVQWRGTRLPRRPVFLSAALVGRPRLDRLVGGCDVAWVPAPAPVAVSAAVPLVLTVHDLSFEHRPADFGRYERLWHRAARPRAIARRAARVIAVSETVRRQLLSEWGLPPERVVTVPSGPGRPRVAPGPRLPGLPTSYVLAVGALEPRKQPQLLARAHAAARADGLRSGLVFAGDGRLRVQLEETGAKVLGFVPDAELEALFAGALAVACPSREEGFGLVPLEAAARGVPAVVSDLPVFRDNLGEAALLVPQGDPRALADALLRLEREPSLRAGLAAAAPKAAGRFSWERAAVRTRDVLEEACA
jgi:glycosyltransferase involved in cell wall biosynthesis